VNESTNKSVPTIRVADNTENPCLLVLKQKGYELRQWFIRDADGEYEQHFDAVKDGRKFSAERAEEVLGLAVMWETRGEDWQTRADEPDMIDRLYPQSNTYDAKGRVVEIGDEDVGRRA